MIPLVTRIAALERDVAELKERDRGGYLSMKDAAEYLGISYAGIKNHVRLGHFAVVKMGSGQNARVLIARAQIERFLRKHAVPAVSAATLRAAVPSVRAVNDRAPRRWHGSFE